MSTILFDNIKAQAKITDTVIVGFSGGKDSIVTMDLCFRYFKKVYPFFLYIVPDLSFQQKTIKWYENYYNTDIIQLPHPDMSAFMKYGSFRPLDMSVSEIGINDIYAYVRQKTGAYWIAAGERIADSIIRRAMIKKSSSIDEKRGRFYPISGWRKHDVLNYIKFKKLYLPIDSKKLGFSFKSLDPNELKMVKTYFPDDYEKILRFYPLAEAGVKRAEYYGSK